MKRTGPTLFHDDLSPTNFPVYFYQFAEHAARHGLQYLAETDFFVTQEVSASAEMAETLNQLQTDVMKREQYLDFLRCRRFRQTLLCHDSVLLNRTPGFDCLDDLHFLSLSSPVSDEVDLTPGVVAEFRGGQGAAMSTAHPLSKAVLGYLSKSWPRAPQFQEILSEAQSRLAEISAVAGEPLPSSAEDVSQLLLAAYGAGLLDALLHVPRFALELTERPVASPVARLKALPVR